MSPESAKKIKRVILFIVIIFCSAIFYASIHNLDLTFNTYKTLTDLNRDEGKFKYDINDFYDCNSAQCTDYGKIYTTSMSLLLFSWLIVFGVLVYLVIFND